MAGIGARRIAVGTMGYCAVSDGFAIAVDILVICGVGIVRG